MAQLTQNPPEGIIPQLVWCIDWIYQLRNRLGSGGGGGGSVSLPVTEIGVGTGTGITSFDQLTYNNSLQQFRVGVAGTDSVLLASNRNLNLAFTAGDVGGIVNNTYLDIDDSTSLVTIGGNKVIAVVPTPPSVSYTPIGAPSLDDMTNTTVTYTGTAASTLYTITLLSTTPGNLRLNDQITWNDGGPESSGIDIPNGGGDISLSNGVIVHFAASNGHTIGDLWQFAYGVTYGKMLSLDGQNHSCIIGDVDGISTSLIFSLEEASPTTWLAGIEDANGRYFSLNQRDGLYGIGNIDNVGGGTGTKVIADDTNKVVILETAIATPTMTVDSSGGATSLIPNGVRGIYIDPASLIVTLAVTTPSAPVDGQEILILFGGTITGAAGAVVTNLTITANSGQTKLGTYPSSATTSTVIEMKYSSATTQWYRID